MKTCFIITACIAALFVGVKAGKDWQAINKAMSELQDGVMTLQSAIIDATIKHRSAAGEKLRSKLKPHGIKAATAIYALRKPAHEETLTIDALKSAITDVTDAYKAMKADFAPELDQVAAETKEMIESAYAKEVKSFQETSDKVVALMSA